MFRYFINIKTKKDVNTVFLSFIKLILKQKQKLREMTGNIEECEILPIPPELLAESQKSIGIVMDSGALIDLNQQGK